MEINVPKTSLITRIDRRYRLLKLPHSPPSIFILNTIYNEGKCSNFEYLPFLFVFEWLVFLAIEMIGH